jgi:hypothetical protein
LAELERRIETSPGKKLANPLSTNKLYVMERTWNGRIMV